MFTAKYIRASARATCAIRKSRKRQNTTKANGRGAACREPLSVALVCHIVLKIENGWVIFDGSRQGCEL